MDLIPDLTVREFVRKTGEHGYACACLTAEVNIREKRVTRILSVRQLPLARCGVDGELPKAQLIGLVCRKRSPFYYRPDRNSAGSAPIWAAV